MAEPEVWLRGPIAGVSPFLQPVAHGLLQCREEAARIVPRHDPPWQRRPWVVTAAGRADYLGTELDCVRRDRGDPVLARRRD